MSVNKSPRTLLLVHHSPSPAMRELLEEVVAGTRDPAIVDVSVKVVPALSASVSDVLGAHAYLLGTPANFGYMSGALKYFFDTTYYPCLDAVAGRPFGVWVHGNNDTAGAVSSVTKLALGMGMVQAASALELIGTPDKEAREASYELGATLAASIME